MCFNHRPWRNDQNSLAFDFFGRRRVDLQENEEYALANWQCCSCCFYQLPSTNLTWLINLKPTNCKCPGGIGISVFLSDCKRRHVSWKQARIVFKRLTDVPEINQIAALNMVTRTWLGQPIHLRVGMTDYIQHQSSVNPHGWFGTN